MQQNIRHGHDDQGQDRRADQPADDGVKEVKAHHAGNQARY